MSSKSSPGLSWAERVDRRVKEIEESGSTCSSRYPQGVAEFIKTLPKSRTLTKDNVILAYPDCWDISAEGDIPLYWSNNLSNFFYKEISNES